MISWLLELSRRIGFGERDVVKVSFAETASLDWLPIDIIEKARND